MLKRMIAVLAGMLFLLVPVMAANAGVDKIIIASNENYPDAIVSSPVSDKLGIPILLTEKDKIPEEVKNTLDDLGPKEIVVVGGPAVVSDDVVSQLKKDYNVTRLWGMSRYGTANEVNSYFWTEGAEEAVLVENDVADKKGKSLGFAKNFAEEKPLFLIPNGKIPADVLTELEDLGVEEVKIIGMNITDEMRNNLKDIGIDTKGNIEAEDEKGLEEEMEKEMEFGKNDSLVVVAAAGFRNVISAPNLPQSKSFLVSSEDEIQDAVGVVNNRNISEVKVVGKPVLAKKIASSLENNTDAEIDLVAERAAEDIEQAAAIAKENREKFAKKFQKRYNAWKGKLQGMAEKMKNNSNKTIQRAKKLASNYGLSSDELQEAKGLFEKGKYIEAREKAREAVSEMKEKRYENLNRTERHEEFTGEVEDLREKVRELKEINREFGKEMMENMSVEERLETIQEFKEERMEKVEELVGKAREMKRGNRSIEKWLNKARGKEDVGNKSKETNEKDNETKEDNDV